MSVPVNLLSTVAMTSGSKKSPELRNNRYSPVACAIPLFMAWYIPLSFSEHQYEKCSSYWCSEKDNGIYDAFYRLFQSAFIVIVDGDDGKFFHGFLRIFALQRYILFVCAKS